MDAFVRYYDPVAGRFLSTDPVLTDQNSAAHFNRYTYALNNPYKYVDPDGRMPFLIPIGIFLLKEAAAEVASHYTGGASDFLSVRRSAQNVGGFAMKKVASAAAETVEKAAAVKVVKTLDSVVDAKDVWKSVSREQKAAVNHFLTGSEKHAAKAGEPVTTDTLKKYLKVAEQQIKNGLDKNNEQQRRVEKITEALKKD